MPDETPGGDEPHPPLLNGYPMGQTPPTPLPGRSAQQLQWRSAWLQIAAAVVGAPIFAESLFKQYQPWYALGFISAVVALVARSFFLIARGRQLAKAELLLGYTTILVVARRLPGVFLFHPVTKAVVAVPGQPRPARIAKDPDRAPTPTAPT